ncbi:uncharacterized protein [Glycine max]|uniref:uncharacterized protein n=1 Tax=Glycine max TaxID=3847 RepID=UPI001B3569B9|nr:uncharacterized protein LOC102664487 [Glycine max]
MVLMNHTGTNIGATLWQELFPEFEPKLRCGGAYVIQNVKVVDTHSDYKVSAIKYLVYFVKTTSVKEVDRPEIPPNVHAITSFADIISGVAKPDTLVNIVGVIVEVIERKTINPAYRVTVKLRDNSHVEIIMTVWEEYALQLDDAIEQNHFVQKLLVVMLTLAKIKEPKDKYPLSVQNIKHGSKLYVNGDIVEIQQFHDSLRVPFYIGGLDDEGGVSQSQSTYCPYCTTTFDPLKIGAACRSCQNHVTHTIPRYKLVVKMEQNGEKANFHFWDAVCIKIFGKTADEYRQELIASGDEIKVFPACVDQLLGKTWVVRFKHRIQMHQSSVLDFSEQEHHIQSVIFTLGLQDEQCISNKSAAVGAASSSQQDYHPTPSLSQSSEYDPGNAAFVTPAKRTSDQQGSSQFDSDDFTTYELSTNKHIKDPPMVFASGMTYQFKVVFHVDRNIIEVPSIYHKQWAPDYPDYVVLDYNGKKHHIRVRKFSNRVYIANGLKHFRSDMGIYEGDDYVTVLGVRGRRHFWKLSMHNGLKCFAEPWFQFLTENDLMAVDEVVFYFRPNQLLWEVIARKKTVWDEDEDDSP